MRDGMQQHGLHLVECGYRCGFTDVVTDVVTDVRDGMQQHGLHLQLVLGEVVAARQLGKLVGELDAAVHILRRDEVERHLDTRGEVAHLVGAAARDEDGVAVPLHQPPAAHAVLRAQPAAQRGVQVE